MPTLKKYIFARISIGGIIETVVFIVLLSGQNSFQENLQKKILNFY